MNDTIQVLMQVIPALSESNIICNNGHFAVLPRETCIDGKVDNCNEFYCLGRGKLDVCCIINKVLDLLITEKEHLEQLMLKPSTSDWTEYKYILIAFLLGFAVAFAIATTLFCIFWRKQEIKRRKCHTTETKVPARKTSEERKLLPVRVNMGDGDNRMAALNDKNLMTPEGDLNLRKIKSKPEETQSQIGKHPGDTHKFSFVQESNETSV